MGVAVSAAVVARVQFGHPEGETFGRREQTVGKYFRLDGEASRVGRRFDDGDRRVIRLIGELAGFAAVSPAEGTQVGSRAARSGGTLAAP
jgi:hypothetical protein